MLQAVQWKCTGISTRLVCSENWVYCVLCVCICAWDELYVGMVGKEDMKTLITVTEHYLKVFLSSKVHYC